MNTALAKWDLFQSLKDDDYREGFTESHVYTGIAFQARTLREKRGMTQAALGSAAGMAQERISILEDPNANTKPTLNTLLRLAKAFGVGLQVRFVPYSKLLDDAVRTDEEELNVRSFSAEARGLESQLTAALFAATHPHVVSIRPGTIDQGLIDRLHFRPSIETGPSVVLFPPEPGLALESASTVLSAPTSGVNGTGGGIGCITRKPVTRQESFEIVGTADPGAYLNA